MAIIVQPKTQAELNQLVSVLHSTGRNIDFKYNIELGCYFHTWNQKVYGAHVHAKVVTPDCTNKYVPVNKLYEYLNKH